MVTLTYGTCHQRAAFSYLALGFCCCVAAVAITYLIPCYMCVTCGCMAVFSDFLHALLSSACALTVLFFKLLLCVTHYFITKHMECCDLNVKKSVMLC